MKSMKKISIIIFLLIWSVLLSGCGADPDQGERTVRIGLLRIDDSVPFYVAEKEGLFEENGVKAELIGFNSSADQSQAMEAGELDMAMNDMVVQGLMKKGGTDTKTVSIAFGATPEEGRFILASAPGIDADADLTGMTVAISNNTMMDYLLDQFSALGYVDRAALGTVSMPNLMLRTEALIEGRDIQLAILPEPLASYAIKAGCGIVVDDTKTDVNLSQSVVLATQKIIEDDEDAVRRVLDSYYAAMELVNADPDGYRDFCLDTANVPKELSDTYPTPMYTPHALPDEEGVSRVTTWLAERGLTDRIYDYDEVVNVRFQ
jgi:NitT/TauT family transport system substrate-binding protein